MAAPPRAAAEDDSASLGSLADAESCHEALLLPRGNTAWLLDLLRRMVLIRAAEEKIGDMVAEGRVRSPR